MSVAGAKWIWLVGLVLILLTQASPVRAAIVINEVLANNQTIAPSPEDPEYFPDYVELYNTAATPVSLAGYRIEDSSGSNYTFSANQTIGGNGFLLVYFDDDDGVSAPGSVHTGFGLSASKGDSVILKQGLVEVTRVDFGIQAPDYSIGRIPSGTGTIQLNRPTPGATNVGVVLGNPFVLKINEWLATNSAGADRDWFEIYNPSSNAISLAGLVFADKASSNSVPISYFINGQQIWAIPPTKPNSFIAEFGYVQIFASDKSKDADEVSFSLSSTSGDDIWIFASNSLTGVIDHVSFRGGQQRNQSEGRLPDGGSYQDDSGINIKLTSPSPGDSNFGPIPEIVINEFLAHVDPPLEDAIELHNPTTTNVSVGGWWLSNNRNSPKKFQIPIGTIIPAGGFKVFYEYEFNNVTNAEPFNLNSAHGGELYLFKARPDGELLGFRRGVTFGASENGVSFGRWVNSATNVDIYPMASLTFGTSVTRTSDPGLTNLFRTGAGAPNSYPKVGPIVVNEIHYHPRPIVGTNDNRIDEFIEIYNFSTNDVPLFDPVVYDYQGDIYAYGETNTWRIRGGPKFDFPTNITLAARSHLLVVNFDPITNATQLVAFTNRFGIVDYPGTVQIVGPYKGNLNNGGATIELQRPDPPQGPPLHNDERGFVPYTMADLVKYKDEAPWPISTNLVGPDGFGQSLQRIVASDYGNEPMNWMAAQPTAGRGNSSNSLSAPVIVTGPASQSGVEGSSASFNVEASGEELFYRWQFNGVQINGATNETLILDNLSTNSAGLYRAVVINAAGIVYSADAALTNIVNRSDVTNDFVMPTVSFTSPADGRSFSDPNVTISGRANDNLAVAYVELSVNDGPFLPVSGISSWSKDVVLNPGVNTFRARATDLNTNQSLIATWTLTYTTNTVNLIINGQGTVQGVTSTTPLVIGQDYTISARPAPGWVFSQWFVVISNSVQTFASSTLTFTMRTGIRITALFTPNPYINVAGTYNGLFYEPTEVRPESAGYFSLRLNKVGAYSAQIHLGGKRYPCRGILTLNGLGTNVITPVGLPPLTIRWALDTEGGSDRVEGAMTSGSWTNELRGDRATHHVLYNRALHGGRYTFALPGAPIGRLDEPEGDSYGTIQVGSNGAIIMAGSLAENVPFTQTTTLAKNGDIPLYFPAYRGAGLLLGWINLGPAAPTNHFSGLLSWVKPGTVGGTLYPKGFTNEAYIVGSRYEAPDFTNRVLNVDGQGRLSLAGGDLAPGFSEIVDFLLGGNVTYSGIDKLTVTLSKFTGAFKGAWTRTGTKTPIRFSGVYLQSYTNGLGFVISSNHIGRVTIEAD